MCPWQSFILGLCEHLAWPFLVAICIFVFRNDIRRMLSRITKLPGGAELNPETIEEQEENKSNFNELFAKKTEEKTKQKELKKEKEDK